MWQDAMAATNASSGSTPAGSESGGGTTSGEAEAGTSAPPSKVHRCARLKRLSVKAAPLRCHSRLALYSPICKPPSGNPGAGAQRGPEQQPAQPRYGEAAGQLEAEGDARQP